MLEIFAVIFVIKKTISLAKQKGVRPAGWAIMAGITYGVTALSTGFIFGLFVGMGTFDDKWLEFPKSLLLSVVAIIVGLLCSSIPLLILKNKPDANHDIASPFEKEKDIDESNTDILDA